MKVALFGQKTSTSLHDIVEPFLQFLDDKNVEFCLEHNFKSILSQYTSRDLSAIETFDSYEPLDKSVKFMFTFGGDGTILNAITYIQDSGIPIVGVNTGRLGFLATINKNLFLDQLEAIFEDEYKLVPRSLLTIHSEKPINLEYNFALNEITVTRRETTSMITVDSWLNGEFLNSFWADGLIVSTPTGSTGYSLSCGGPIVHPSNENFIVTPIAPHNLNVRPLVLDDDGVIDLKIKIRANEYFLSLDSRNIALPTSVEIQIKKADFYIYIVETNEINYFNTLREKLLWGSDKRN